MKRTSWRVLIALCVFLAASVQPVPTVRAQSVPADIASYTIDASYDPVSHQITARETITYRNLTETPIGDLVFHLYLNAFRSDDTLWMREAGPQHRGYGYDPNEAGWMRVDDIRLANDVPLSLSPVDPDETLVKADLPTPVGIGETVKVTLAFTAQLPRVFARTGWADGGDFVMAGQWFPKLGVWEDGAWNAYHFHANSEFYADFGAYDVTLTLPAEWVVGATGTVAEDPEPVADGVSHRFHADHVIDFAWSASPHFAVLNRTAHQSTGDVRIEVLYYRERRALADRVMAATVEGLALFGEWYGPYGGGHYPELTVILVPPDAGGAGGMEYPTLFTVGVLAIPFAPDCIRFIEAETVHELAHQWFQSVIATNEAEAPWLDEGFAEYSTVRAMRALSKGDVVTCGGWTMSYLYSDRRTYMMSPHTTMSGRAWEVDNYGVAAYAKPALALTTLERRVGDAAMQAFLSRYFTRYAFAHPDEDDVRAVMAETLGQELATWFFEELVMGTGTVDARIVTLEPDELEIEREGTLCLPVQVALVERHDVETSTWSCMGALEPDVAALISAVIDPDHTMVLDLNFANNGRRRSVDEGGWLRATVGVLRQLQTLFRGGGVW